MKSIVAGLMLMSGSVFAGSVYVWNGPNATDRSGSWEEAGNWLVGGVSATTYPGEISDTDEVWLTNGTYTVTMAESHTVLVFQAHRNGDYSPASTWATVTVDLGGKQLSVTKRLDVTCETYSWGANPSNPHIPLSVSFTHGVVSSPSEIAVQNNGGTATAYEKATGVGSGLAWGASYAARVRGLLGFTGEDLTAYFNAMFLVSTHSRIYVADGARVVVTNRVTLSGSNGTPSVMLHVTGEGSHFSCKQLYDHGYAGHTNIFENGSVSSVGKFFMGMDQWGKGDGGYTIIRSGATLNLTNMSEDVFCNDQRDLRPMHVVLTGAGSKLTMAGNANFWIQKKANSPTNTLDVLDGAVFQGTTSDLLIVGSADGANCDTGKNGDHVVTVSNATLSVGKLLVGPRFWDERGSGLGGWKYGASSNNVIRVEGRKGRVEISGTGRARQNDYGEKGTANLNYGTLLSFAVPVEGFAQVPFAVTNGTLQAAASQLIEGAPACRLEIAARAWTRKNKGKAQTLVMTAQDSTAALQTLMDNVTFADFKDGDELPTLSIETSGTQTSLVLTAPPPKGLMLLLR